MQTTAPKSAIDVHEKHLTRAFHYGKIDYIKSIKSLAETELSMLNRFFKFYLEHTVVNSKLSGDAEDLNELTPEEEQFFKLYNQKIKMYQKIDRIHSLCQYYLKQP